MASRGLNKSKVVHQNPNSLKNYVDTQDEDPRIYTDIPVQFLALQIRQDGINMGFPPSSCSCFFQFPKALSRLLEIFTWGGGKLMIVQGNTFLLRLQPLIFKGPA